MQSELARLAEHPVTLSRKAGFPFQQGQLFPCWLEDDDGGKYHVTVLFKYWDDEEQLIVARLSIQRFTP